jgi:hypothetical protein
MITTEGWRKFYNEEIHNFYSSSDITNEMKSRGVIRTGHTVLMGVIRNSNKILVEKYNMNVE